MLMTFFQRGRSVGEGKGEKSETQGINKETIRPLPRSVCTDTQAAVGVCGYLAHSENDLHQAMQHQQEKQTAHTLGQTAAERPCTEHRHSRSDSRYRNGQSHPQHPLLLQNHSCPQDHFSLLQLLHRAFIVSE